MWFLFYWINKYFLELYCNYDLLAQSIQDASIYSLRYKTVPVSSFSAFQIANRLFKMHLRVYLEICLFMHHSYGPSWVQTDMLTASDQELIEISPCWSSVLSGQDLLNRVRPNARLTNYQPSCTIRIILLNN